MHTRALRAALLLACVAPGACRTATQVGASQAGPATADSIVLERTRCYGTCPAYRLSVAAAGQVAFTSRNPGDEGRSARDSTTPGAFAGLVREAREIGFFALPDTIAADRTLCPAESTDSPTATVTVFARAGTKQVVDYRGCGGGADPEARRRVAALRALEARIDSVAGSSRWVRPARR